MFCLHTVKKATVLFQTIQFSISTQFSSIWPINRILLGATTLGLSRPGSNGNEGVLESSSIIGTSPSDCFASYTGHLLEESYLLAEKQLVYFPAPVNRATVICLPTVKWLIGITTVGQSGPESNGNERVYPHSTEPHHQMV